MIGSGRALLLVCLLCISPALASSSGAAVPIATPAGAQIAPEYTAFAKRLEKAISTGEGLPAGGFLDRDRVVDRALKGYEDSGEMVSGFRKGFTSATPIEVSLHQRVATAGDSYTLLRVRRRDGEIRALYRLLGENGAVTYNDWILEKNAAGQVVPVDLYLASSGERVSDTARTTFERFLAAQPGVLQRMVGKKNGLLEAIPKLNALQDKLKQHQYVEGLALAHQIPAPFDRSKSVLLTRLQLAEGLKSQDDAKGEHEYQLTMAEFAKAYPGDPALDLVCIDELLAEKKYAQVFQSLDRLDAFTGGDAHLEFLRGSVLITRNGPHDLDAATEQLDHAIAREPTLANPYWGMVTVSLKRADYPATARWLTQIEDRLHIPLSVSAVQKSEQYQGFAHSAAFRSWARAHDKKK